jgi:hypothetical protein
MTTTTAIKSDDFKLYASPTGVTGSWVEVKGLDSIDPTFSPVDKDAPYIGDGGWLSPVRVGNSLNVKASGHIMYDTTTTPATKDAGQALVETYGYVPAGSGAQAFFRLDTVSTAVSLLFSGLPTVKPFNSAARDLGKWDVSIASVGAVTVATRPS